jgi:hypothetical protein
MEKKQKHYFVNWIDGMKISKDHFIGIENAFVYLQHTWNKSQVNPYNFGLLSTNGDEPALDFSCNIGPDRRLDLTLNRCKALTSGGHLIDIDSAHLELTDFTLRLQNFNMDDIVSGSGQYYIVLKVNPYRRVPVGNADPDENPPRHPFVIPEFDISVIPAEQINKAGFGGYFLVIGKLLETGDKLMPDPDYIPPCSRISSSEKLIAAESRIANLYRNFETNVFIIIKKIHAKQQKTPLANSALYFTDKLTAYFGLNMTGQYFLKHLPPVFLFETVQRCATFIRNILATLPPENKEELINYFSDWCNLKQGELENIISGCASAEYNHFEISRSMLKMMKFMETMTTLFDTLSTLEYVGKRRDTQIYIKEETKPKKSFLADD